jgi:hypothetical protein
MPSDCRPELDAPLTDRLVSHFDAAFAEKLLDITQTQREPILQPDGALDDLGREAVTATDGLGHRSASRQGPRPGKLLNLTNPDRYFAGGTPGPRND